MAVVNVIPKTLAQEAGPVTAAVAQTWVDTNGSWLRRIVSKHDAWLKEENIAEYQAAYDGYLEEIDKREKGRGDDVNKKLQANFSQLIIDTVVDYMLGNPISWTFDDPENKASKNLLEAYRKDLLQLLRSENAQRVLSEQLRQGSIVGYSGVISWVDETGGIDYEEFPSQELIPIYDSRGRLQMVLRKYQVEVEKEAGNVTAHTKIEVYDSKYVSYYLSDETGENYTLDKTEAETGNPVIHHAARIPVSIFTNGTAARYTKRQHKAGTSDLGNGVLTMLVEYAHILSDKANTVDRLLDQYLLLTGVDTDEKEVLKMRKARALALKSKDSKAGFIAPTQDDKAVENMLDRLEKDIHEQTFTPRLSDLSGATATEIKMKYANLDIKAGKKEIYFTAAIKELIAILTDLLNTKRLREAGVQEENLSEALEGSSIDLYNPEWVQFTLNRNLPQNFLEIAQIVAQLVDIVPDSYLYELLWFIEDPVAALDEMKKQKKEKAKMAQETAAAAMGFGGEFASTGSNEGDNQDPEE
jgi:SPP1 family phage portal protein